MTALEHVGAAVAILSLAGLVVLVVLGVRTLRREAREAELLPTPRHYADGWTPWPGDGFCTCYGSERMRDCGIKAHRDMAGRTDLDVPGPRAQPQQTTRGPGHQPPHETHADE